MIKRIGFVGLVFLFALASTYAQATRYFVYVVNSVSNNISAYTMNAATGTLSPVSGSPFPAGATPSGGIAADPKGKILYVVNEAGKNVSAYMINSSTGALSSIAGSPFQSGRNHLGIATARSGSSFTLQMTAVRTCPLSRSIQAPILRGAWFTFCRRKVWFVSWQCHSDPTGKFLYAADWGGHLFAYQIKVTSGALTLVSGSPFATGAGLGTRATPTGKFLYVTNSDAATISAYTLKPGTGALCSGGSPFITEICPTVLR